MSSRLERLRSETTWPVVIADQYGVIIFTNERFTAFTGWDQSDVVGRPLTTIIPATLHDAHNLGFSRFLMTGKPTLLDRPLMLQVVAKDGRLLESEHVIVAENMDGQWQFGATLKPAGVP